MSTRPFLLLDVDGVLNPIAAFPGHEQDGFAFAISVQNGRELTLLRQDFDIVWVSAWEGNASQITNDAVGRS